MMEGIAAFFGLLILGSITVIIVTITVLTVRFLVRNY